MRFHHQHRHISLLFIAAIDVSTDEGGRGGSAGLIAKVTSPLGTPICAHMQMSWQGRGSRWHICKCRLAGLLC